MGNVGLQVSGYTNFPLAVALWTICAALLIWAAAQLLRQRGVLWWRPSGTIPLTQAAMLIYERAGPAVQKIAQEFSATGATPILDWGRSALVIGARNGLATLYGRREAGAAPTAIPRADLDNR